MAIHAGRVAQSSSKEESASFWKKKQKLFSVGCGPAGLNPAGIRLGCGG
jgi:hypothetical protein